MNEKYSVRYSIGQVAKMIGVESHTVRFWTNELEAYISPEIGAGDRRYFTQEHIDVLKSVNNLINNKGYTLSVIKKNGIKHSYESDEHATEIQHNLGQTLSRIEKIQKNVREIISGI